MKKSICIIFCLMMIVGLFTGCGSKNNGNPTDNTKKPSSKIATIDSKEMKTNLSTSEYTLYQNIFYNDQKNDYNKKDAKKEGTFATLYDAFNKVERYYVWGYNDNTKCCDWQWEIKFDKDSDKPTNGSYVEVTGKYEVNDDALDKFWIINPKITVKEAYEDRGFDIDMCSMSGTLQYVEIQNIVNLPDSFKGKTVCGYGRMQSAASVEDAYYDNKWALELSTDSEIPSFGTVVVFTGVAENGALKNAKIYQNTQY